MPRKFDPRLKAAMQEIRDILTNYDIAGQIVLVSPTHSEFNTHFPTWSLAQFETDEHGEHIGIRFNTNRFQFTSDKGKHAATENSVHILDQLRHNAMMHFAQMDEIMTSLGEHMHIESDIRNPQPHDLNGEMAAFDKRNQSGKKRRGFAP